MFTQWVVCVRDRRSAPMRDVLVTDSYWYASLILKYLCGYVRSRHIYDCGMYRKG
jgi:hypothetical protein